MTCRYAQSTAAALVTAIAEPASGACVLENRGTKSLPIGTPADQFAAFHQSPHAGPCQYV